MKLRKMHIHLVEVLAFGITVVPSIEVYYV